MGIPDVLGIPQCVHIHVCAYIYIHTYRVLPGVLGIPHQINHLALEQSLRQKECAVMPLDVPRFILYVYIICIYTYICIYIHTQ